MTGKQIAILLRKWADEIETGPMADSYHGPGGHQARTFFEFENHPTHIGEAIATARFGVR